MSRLYFSCIILEQGSYFLFSIKTLRGLSVFLPKIIFYTSFFHSKKTKPINLKYMILNGMVIAIC